MTVTDPYLGKDDDELLAICQERGIPTGARRPFRSTLVRLLKTYDSDLERFRGLGRLLGVEIPEEMGPRQAELFLEPHALERLTSDGYFVPGQVSKKQYLYRGEWSVLTGRQQMLATHLQVTSKFAAAQKDSLVKVLDIFQRIYVNK